MIHGALSYLRNIGYRSSMCEKTLNEIAVKRNLHYILPEAEKRPECLLFPKLNHRPPVRYAVWIMQVRHTNTHAHEAITKRKHTTCKEMGTRKQGHQFCENKFIIALRAILRNTLALFACHNYPLNIRHTFLSLR
jgi:hypothetical protein